MKVSMRLYKRYKNGIFLSYYIAFDNGVRTSLKTKNAEKARKLFRELEKLYLKQKTREFAGICNITLEQFYDEFESWSLTVQKKSTRRANLLGLRKIMEQVDPKIMLDKITLRHVDKMIAAEKQKGTKDRSINNYIRHSRTAINKAVEWDYIKVNPIRHAKELRVSPKQPKYLSKPQIGKLLSSIDDIDLRRLVTAYIATGRRRSELLSLEWRDIEQSNHRYLVRKSKTYLQRYYPLNSLFNTVLDAIGEGNAHSKIFGRWRHPDTISHKVKKCLTAAGFREHSLHSLRHTYASLKAADGATLQTIRDLLGHTDIKTTQIYAHLTDAHIAESAEIKIGPVDLGSKK